MNTTATTTDSLTEHNAVRFKAQSIFSCLSTGKLCLKVY